MMAKEEKGQKMERGQTLGREHRQMTRPDSELSSVSSLVDLRTRGVIELTSPTPSFITRG